MAKVTKPAAPDRLTMNLFAPGMTALHRAGLGGLACTLKAIERHHDLGMPDDKLPGEIIDGEYPWEVDEQSVALRFGKPENAGAYLKKLFAFAFQIRDGVIFLPGQYGDTPPSLGVRAALQDGIQNTFLQHGPTCGSREGERTVTVEVNDVPLSVTHDVFTSYKHQGWFWLDRDEKSKEKDPLTGKKSKTGERVKNRQDLPVVTEGGSLSGEAHHIDNKLLPGAMVRHKFDQSALRETDAGLICLHFAMVGCLALSINRVTAALLSPAVDNLVQFCRLREFLTPRTPEECRIAGAADAALQAQVRVRARRDASDAEVPGCHVMTCRPTAWNQKQKPRVGAADIHTAPDTVLDRFERALALLPPRLVVPKPPESKGTRPSKAKVKEPFWTDSVVRPLVAENLALDRPWYAGFTRLMACTNPATRKPYRDQLSFERRGLQVMTGDQRMWDQDGEQLVVKAVHEAMRSRYGQIADENKTNPVGMRSRMERFRERLRIALAGAKRDADVRFALTDLFSRGGSNAVLRAGWAAVLPVLRRDWQLARDLGLLALASYAGREAGDAKTDPINPEDDKS